MGNVVISKIICGSKYHNSQFSIFNFQLINRPADWQSGFFCKNQVVMLSGADLILVTERILLAASILL